MYVSLMAAAGLGAGGARCCCCCCCASAVMPEVHIHRLEGIRKGCVCVTVSMLGSGVVCGGTRAWRSNDDCERRVRGMRVAVCCCMHVSVSDVVYVSSEVCKCGVRSGCESDAVLCAVSRLSRRVDIGLCCYSVVVVTDDWSASSSAAGSWTLTFHHTSAHSCSSCRTALPYSCSVRSRCRLLWLLLLRLGLWCRWCLLCSGSNCYVVSACCTR